MCLCSVSIFQSHLSITIDNDDELQHNIRVLLLFYERIKCKLQIQSYYQCKIFSAFQSFT